VVEVGHDINAYGDRLEADPERLGEIEERVALLKRLCRKYGANLEAVSEHERELRREWAELTGEGQSLEDLEKACRSAEKAYRETAGELTRARRETASELEKQLVGELKPLAMEKVIFVCQIAPTAPTNTGLDRVEFYFSPNPGEKIQPLSATASGGEMSRFLLALQACFSKVRGRSGTLIFDEIDVGVSGKVAGAIAEKLHQLSRGSQVLCVTHQPLVAAMADRHFRVDKLMIEERDPAEGDIPADLAEIRTVVRVTTLDNRKTRREELAQLAGGQSAADALAFAESLLVKAEGRKG
jgi:DNA repair protein RecN (Recombination protein N)